MPNNDPTEPRRPESPGKWLAAEITKAAIAVVVSIVILYLLSSAGFRPPGP